MSEKPEVQNIIDELHDGVRSPEDQATLEAWQAELNTERSQIAAERGERDSAGLVDNAGRLVTRKEVGDALESGHDPHVVAPRR